MEASNRIQGEPFVSADAPASMPSELESYFERMRPTVDETIERLGSARFREDPIAGRKYSRATSIVSSAYKRHGPILQRALLERLKDCARLRVWAVDDFKLSHDTLREVRIAERPNSLLETDFPYGDRERSVNLDLLVFDEATESLKAYSVKRGNGSYDANKRRVIHQELVRTQMQLADYGRQLGYRLKARSAHVVFYYGLLSLPPPLGIPGEDLDDHFQFPVREAIEYVNAYFVGMLSALVEQE